MKIKNKIELELAGYIRKADKLYSLSRISPVLFNHIREFISRKGKRVRPILFVISYLGFTKQPAIGLYRSAVSLELLHDFLLVHDDIIDKSALRRGQPSMHAMLNKYLMNYKNIKFDGEDLTIVIDDIMYAMALDAFLSVKEDLLRKELALRKLIQAAFYTGSGEFIELLYGLKNVDQITQEDIYRIYDYKTANYTFATPLCMGAILAGAKKAQIDKLLNYGIYFGRAFQIKDDIIGLFGKEGEIGKSNLTDLQEAKKTILVWYAYHHSGSKNKSAIRRILAKTDIDRTDLLKMRCIIADSGTLDYAKQEINALIKKAQSLNACFQMRAEYKNALFSYSKELMDL
ncbi:MAG: polyprenyl synthetase family protein [Candidatus Omnitrophota bacterium]